VGAPGPGWSNRIVGPPLTSVLLIQRSEHCTVYRFPPAGARRTAIGSLFDS
jgi:hypothetical protein